MMVFEKDKQNENPSKIDKVRQGKLRLPIL